MTDEEIRKILQRAFGYAPEQLVAELNRTRNELIEEEKQQEEKQQEEDTHKSDQRDFT